MFMLKVLKGKKCTGEGEKINPPSLKLYGTWAVALLFAVLTLAGCEQVRGLLDPEAGGEEPDSPNGGPVSPDPPGDPDPVWLGKPVAGAADIASIKAKFDVKLTGIAGVNAAFNELHAYIQNGGLATADNVIHLGDWIDMEGGLTVEPYGIGGGGFAYTDEDAVQEVTLEGALHGTRCRVIVVGINSFSSTKGSNSDYGITVNDGVDHVVFQFQNIPVQRQWSNNSWSGGYEKSEMRAYLTGNFLAGLEAAGVPDVLWSPERVVAKGGDKEGATKVTDALWLPTEREMIFGIADHPSFDSMSQYSETSSNQAWLEYYTDNDSRCKKNVTDTSDDNYWLASPSYAFDIHDNAYFCYVTENGTIGPLDPSMLVTEAYGVVPAFCVN
jgi:hypothetical protein